MRLGEDLKNYGKREDAFQLITEELAGAIIGGALAALMLYDFAERALEHLSR